MQCKWCEDLVPKQVRDVFLASKANANDRGREKCDENTHGSNEEYEDTMTFWNDRPQVEHDCSNHRYTGKDENMWSVVDNYDRENAFAFNEDTNKWYEVRMWSDEEPKEVTYDYALSSVSIMWTG